MTGTALDARRRRAVFAELESRTFDFAVIGGGITGAGIARDAAMRGLSVALVEARDYASGTSSRSSKMIHGGLRYLAQGDIALVKEAASERQILRRIAPHLTRLSPFLIPTTNMAMTAKLRTGLWTFEKLGGAELCRRTGAGRAGGVTGNRVPLSRDRRRDCRRAAGARGAAGSGRSDTLMPLQADALQRPVRRHAVREASAYGAALAAGMRAGLFGESDLKRLARYDAEFLSKVERDEADAAFARWQAAVAV